MADICDITDDVLEAELAAARSENAAKLANCAKPTGFCHYCETPLSNPKQIYCDCDCAKGHELEQKMSKISGKPMK